MMMNTKSMEHGITISMLFDIVALYLFVLVLQLLLLLGKHGQ